MVFANNGDGSAGAHKPLPSLKHMLELLIGVPAQFEYIPISTSRLSDALILSKTH
jgi:hypothetical protein